MPVGPVGRSEELDAISTALSAAADGNGQLVDVVGEAGIGKSRVLDAVADDARQRGARVWKHAPTRPEAELPWTGLAALVSHATEADLGAIPAPARRQLAAATSAGSTDVVEPQVVAFALAELLDVASGPGHGDRTAMPLVVIIDDSHWLDPSSAGALSYALRGVPRRRGLVVLARRGDETRSLEPERLVPADHFRSIHLAGLSLASMRDVLMNAVGVDLRRGDLARIHQRSGGNALHAIEIANLVAAGHPLNEALLPTSLRATLRGRVDSLPASTLDVLRAAAMLATPRADVVARACPGIDVIAACAAAEEAGVVAIRPVANAPRGDVVVFTHPLLAAATIDSMSTAARRLLHSRLADVVDDLGEQAIHVAASEPEPAESVAMLLESAGRRGMDRGAPELAVEHFRASVAATPWEGSPSSSDAPWALRRRQLAMAEAQTQAGQNEEALATLTELTEVLDPKLSATVTSMLVLPVSRTQDSRAGREAAIRALAVVTDPAARAQHHQQLATLETFDDVARGLTAARRAFDEAREAGDDSATQIALVGLAGALVLAGERPDIDAAIEVAERWPSPWRWWSPPGQLVHALVWLDHPHAVAHAERVLAAGAERGDRIAESNCLAQLGATFIVRGEWVQAEAVLRRAIEFGSIEPALGEVVDLAYLLASTGRVDEGARMVERMRTNPAGRSRGRLDALHALVRQGMIGIASGDGGAVDVLAASELAAIDVGLRAVRVLPFRRDLVEALVAAGRVDEAVAAHGRLVEDSERSDLDNARADAAAAGAVVEAANGNADAAQQLFAVAAAIQERNGLRFELARTRLAAGAAARRAGRRSDARDHLEDAAALFSAMGARPWKARCAGELARIGVRSAGGGPRAGDLTPTERQIADLVAAGRTNAEIAQTLFVSVRTVESNLTRIYRKLNLRSRTELTRHIGATSSH